jgi:hypothetical protein
MPVSFLLQLVPDALAQSRVVGQVKDIETGATARLRSTDDLLSFLFSCAERGDTTRGDVAGDNDGNGRPDGDRPEHSWLETPDWTSGSVLEESPEAWKLSRQTRDGRPK